MVERLHVSLRLVLRQQRESSTATLSFDVSCARFAWFGDLRIAAVGEVLDGKLAALFEHLGIAAPDQLLTATPCPQATRRSVRRPHRWIDPPLADRGRGTS